jgi:hypothetical protein
LDYKKLFSMSRIPKMKVNCESRMLHLSSYRCVGGMGRLFPFSNRGLDRKFSTSKYQWLYKLCYANGAYFKKTPTSLMIQPMIQTYIEHHANNTILVWEAEIWHLYTSIFRNQANKNYTPLYSFCEVSS